jgi:predicted MFS family arabinose efflux permease
MSQSLNPPRDHLVVASLFLLLFLGLADNQTIPALLPMLGASLGTNVAVTGLLVVFYSLAAALAAFLIGSLSDHYGRRRFLQVGVVVFALASWLSAHSDNFTELAVARTLTGLAAGSLSTCSIAFAGDWFPYEVRGKAIGWISSAYFLALVAVPGVAVVATRFGWRRAFWVEALLACLVAGASLALPRDHVTRQSETHRIANTLKAFHSFLVRRDTSAMLMAGFLASGGMVGFITYIGQWLHLRFGLSTPAIGWVLMLGGVTAGGVSPLGGAASDRLGKRAVSIGSSVVLAVSLVLLPLLFWGLLLLAVFVAVSIAAGFRQGPLTALVTEMVPGPNRGSFVALRNICSQLGISATVSIGGLLYQRRGYAAVTLLCALMSAGVAILLTTRIIEPHAAVEPAG